MIELMSTIAEAAVDVFESILGHPRDTANDSDDQGTAQKETH